jgi:hypothetical protein
MIIAMAGIDWELEEHPEHFIDAEPTEIKNFDDHEGFSTVIYGSGIDEQVLKAAKQLADAHALRIESLIAGNFSA